MIGAKRNLSLWALTAAFLVGGCTASEARPDTPWPGDEDEDTLDVSPTLEGCSAVDRIAGADRFSTAVAMANEFRPDATRFVLVGGEGTSIDGVVAGPLAASLNGAVLLSGAERLPTAVRQRLGEGDEVVLLGGTAVLPAALEDELQSLGVAVSRVAGADRFDTAAQVAREMGSTQAAIIASGEDAARVDALLGGAAGSFMGVPVLLTQKDTLPETTTKALEDLGVTNTIVIGGKAVIDDAVLADLPAPQRVAGADRFSTATAVAQTLGMDPSTTLVAEASPSPDAVVASAFGLPLVYARTDALPEASQSWLAGADRVVLVGGRAALGPEIESAACMAADPQEWTPPVSSNAVDFFTIGGQRPERTGWEYGPAIVLHEGRYHAWYCAPGGGGQEDGISSNWDAIAYIQSDDGRNWTAPKRVLRPRGNYFETSVCDPSVIQKDGRWIMYVTCIDEGAPDGYRGNRICAATADRPDADEWTPVPEPLYTDFSCEGTAANQSIYCVGQPSALVVDDEVRLYVTNRGVGHPGPSPGNLELLTSVDGLSFGAPEVVFDHADVDVKFDRASGYSFMVYGEVDDAHIYWNISADGRKWEPHDDARRIEVNAAVNNNNPGLAGDSRGSFSGQTWAAYGSTVPNTAGANAWGRWNLFRSDVFVGIEGSDEDCRACVVDSCDWACQQGGRTGGTCGVGGSTDPAACCSCE